MRHLLALLPLLFLLVAEPVFAWTATPTGTIVEASYTEPNTNADAPPTSLVDLARTTIYYSIDGTITKALDVPATATTGNGNIVRQVAVPVGPNVEKNVTFWVTAFDTSGNESVKSNEVIVRIDRLPPSAPR